MRKIGIRMEAQWAEEERKPKLRATPPLLLFMLVAFVPPKIREKEEHDMPCWIGT